MVKDPEGALPSLILSSISICHLLHLPVERIQTWCELKRLTSRCGLPISWLGYHQLHVSASVTGCHFDTTQDANISRYEVLLRTEGETCVGVSHRERKIHPQVRRDHAETPFYGRAVNPNSSHNILWRHLKFGPVRTSYLANHQPMPLSSKPSPCSPRGLKLIRWLVCWQVELRPKSTPQDLSNPARSCYSNLICHMHLP